LSVALLGLAGAVEAVPPGAATPIAPSGVVSGHTFAFVWQGVPEATFYYLQINDETASPRLTLWFPTAQVCPGGSATCVVTLTTGFATGDAIWWVQTWNPDGSGPWSAGLRFAVAYLPPSWTMFLSTADRFQLVLSGYGVLDRASGLVWDRNPGTVAESWAAANVRCVNRTVGFGAYGWRLPTIEEARGLVGSGLPPGHPFATDPSNPIYWASTVPYDSALAYFYVATGAISNMAKTGNARAWCVRGLAGH
jgi:hypothetical protein